MVSARRLTLIVMHRNRIEMKHYKLKNALCLLGILVLFLSACTQTVRNEKEAQEILNKFYTDNVPEPINDRYLVNAGKSIVPYLLTEIQKENMPKRGYAILALGKIKDKRALPVLVQMIEKDTTVDKGDVLRAIWHIDRKEGEKISSSLSGKGVRLDRIIELLREGKI
jgi:hypothetical protein